MHLLVGIAALALIAIVLIDAFEAVLLPRRVTHAYRLIRLFYRVSWRLWSWLAALIQSPRRRESFLSLFGPLSLLVLFGTWAVGLIVAFGMLHWSMQTPLKTTDGPPSGLSYAYFSGDTFFTLGYGDLTPSSPLGKILAIVEAGMGFVFLALIISYHPVLSQAFSRRETTISLLDARGGSPPTAAQILIRSRQSSRVDALNSFLVEWEAWSAELLESSLSFPLLSYYRSQHDNQSWLAALTAILDTCALEICGSSEVGRHQARLTFAIARHAAVDLSLVFKIAPVAPEPDRLGPESLEQLRALLRSAAVDFPDGEANAAKLAQLRVMYEPFVNGLSRYFQFKLPGFFPERLTADNWQTSAWMPRTPGIRDLVAVERGDHFV
jgi:nitrate reductase NapE component